MGILETKYQNYLKAENISLVDLTVNQNFFLRRAFMHGVQEYRNIAIRAGLSEEDESKVQMDLEQIDEEIQKELGKQANLFSPDV